MKNNKIILNKKIKPKFKFNFNVFYLMRLIGRNYINNYFAIFLDFIMPAFLMMLIFAVFESSRANLTIPGIILSAVATSSCFSFAISYVNWKNSVIMKKIRISQVSTVQLFTSFIIFYFFISLFAFSFSLSLALLIEKIVQNDKIKVLERLNRLDVGYTIIALIQLILVGTSFGFVLATISRKPNDTIGLGFGFFLMQAFLLGYYLDLGTVTGQGVVRNIGYSMPLYAPSRFFQILWFNGYTLPSGNEYLVDFKIVATSTSSFENITTDFNKCIDTPTTNCFSDLKDSLEKVNYNPVHFAKNFWSLILLGAGWMVFNSAVTITLNKYQKIN